MKLSLFSRFLCLIGLHGPNWFGPASCERSARTQGFVRECEVCGAVWYGREVETRYYRTIGDWVRQPRKRNDAT